MIPFRDFPNMLNAEELQYFAGHLSDVNDNIDLSDSLCDSEYFPSSVLECLNLNQHESYRSGKSNSKIF